MIKNEQNFLKYFTAFIACFLLRLIPFRPPNIEPLLAVQMPFSNVFGYFSTFFFGFMSIVVYDSVTSGIGMWTFITAIAYGFLGIWAMFFFKNRAPKALNYAYFAVMGTLAYDAVTGLTIGPLFFNQSFMNALIGQIPFSAMHLIGNITMALTISPLIHKYITQNTYLEQKTFNKLFNKIA
ncbi:hypothetical protein K8Q94_01715 [Candidatus Nomurabacteria bacterium]|nr:hypothetical protein [Candidatus Nomurabacteria bacterium]